MEKIQPKNLEIEKLWSNSVSIILPATAAKRCIKLDIHMYWLKVYFTSYSLRHNHFLNSLMQFCVTCTLERRRRGHTKVNYSVHLNNLLVTHTSDKGSILYFDPVNFCSQIRKKEKKIIISRGKGLSPKSRVLFY